MSFFIPDVLGGPAVARGNLRGTALVIMALALPSLAVSMRLTSRGSARALVVWFASVAYLLYQAVLFVFATPFNSLFLVYIAMLSQLIVGVILTMFIFESLGIACDQWFGVLADPNTPFASTGAIPFFLGLAVVGSIPLFFYYRSLDRKLLLLQTPQVGPRPTSRPSTV